ncbi:MAG TPA: hypothetical protein VEY51_11665, partial [Chondromyces sp.]|nr:hypothetical protein [Chondromyces sp.]
MNIGRMQTIGRQQTLESASTNGEVKAGIHFGTVLDSVANMNQTSNPHAAKDGETKFVNGLKGLRDILNVNDISQLQELECYPALSILLEKKLPGMEDNAQLLGKSLTELTAVVKNLLEKLSEANGKRKEMNEFYEAHVGDFLHIAQMLQVLSVKEWSKFGLDSIETVLKGAKLYELLAG